MITAKEVANAAAAREMSRRIDAMLYVRFVLGEDLEEDANLGPVVQHVDHFKAAVPSLPRVGLWWIATKGWQVAEKWLTCCSELLKAGSPWQLYSPTYRFTLAILALLALAVLPHRLLPLRMTITPIAKCLYQ